jgi:hypothetical protein
MDYCLVVWAGLKKPTPLAEADDSSHASVIFFMLFCIVGTFFAPGRFDAAAAQSFPSNDLVKRIKKFQPRNAQALK